MNPAKLPRFVLPLAAIAALAGCVAAPPKYDYSAFRESRPHSILVLPPVNDSPDVQATYSVLSQATLPLAESGYYVFPVTLVDETFRQNGLDTPAAIHDVPIAKLRQIFGADAAIYMTVKQYGTSYSIISSETRVTAEARLVDLQTGAMLWKGSASASTAEGQNNSGGGIIGMLVNAVINQVADTLSSRGHQIAGITSQRLLAAGRPNGMLYGPRSPLYMKDGSPAP